MKPSPIFTSPDCTLQSENWNPIEVIDVAEDLSQEFMSDLLEGRRDYLIGDHYSREEVFGKLRVTDSE